MIPPCLSAQLFRLVSCSRTTQPVAKLNNILLKHFYNIFCAIAAAEQSDEVGRHPEVGRQVFHWCQSTTVTIFADGYSFGTSRSGVPITPLAVINFELFGNLGWVCK